MVYGTAVQPFQHVAFHHRNGQKQKRPEYRKYELNGYAEYGWDEDTTLGANLFLHWLEADDTQLNLFTLTQETFTRTNFGLGDSEFFLRQRLLQGDVFGNQAVLSIQPLVKLPVFYESGDQPQSGTDAFDAELRLQGGYGFTLYDRHHYAKLEAAYRKRGGEWQDQWKIDATLGIRLNDSFTLMPQVFIIERAEGKGLSNTNLGAANDYDATEGKVSLLFDVTPQTTLQLGIYSRLQARNTSDGDGVTLGIWHRF
ncbi:MAG: hypothetical protein FJX23_02200 [Alphaproteobacteria bacterium]|nr:hypothetical protein [Alphaproteobacteria bacterium]